ncbi:MAG: endonuclease/exonuclease/phosphatase family protein, partial [Arcanobacterium sp.]|nr:endonuclease/exonuclease/phosphatase family protein [Arcanobacterium sp.]
MSIGELTSENKKSLRKRLRKVITISLTSMLIAVSGLCGYFILTEYKPAATEDIKTSGTVAKQLHTNSEVNILTWNIGFGGLGKNVDFFADGGEMVFTVSKAEMQENLDNIAQTLKEQDADINLIQEIDLASNRTFGFNQIAFLAKNLPNTIQSYAPNFKVKFIPYPMPPLGYMDSGILTTTKYKVSTAARHQLPIPFKWPERIFNLKRALLLSRIPIAHTEKELVVINLHLEAYDDGEGKAAQSQQLIKVFQAEVAKGNYVIAGGDFNQAFPGSVEKYGIHKELWTPPAMDSAIRDSGLTLVSDTSVATC